MADHIVGTRDEWLTARRELLEEEKKLTRRSDELARRRQALPWVRIDEEYSFETDAGPKDLAELFDGHSQMLVFHLMFGPDDEAACPGCTFTADSFEHAVVHVERHGVMFVAVSRAPQERLNDYKRRMGWTFPWVSCGGSDFNLDFALFTDEERRTGIGANFGTPRRAHANLHEEELHGLSAFALEDGVVHHTYSCYDRGTDVLCSSWQLLDRAPRGRGGEPEDWPRRRYEYADVVDSTGVTHLRYRVVK